jgi:hypothetical protein
MSSSSPPPSGEHRRWELETLRRSLAMIPPAQSTTTMKIEEVARVIRDLQRLDDRDRRVTELVKELRTLLADERAN